jgi:hypothetical protein
MPQPHYQHISLLRSGAAVLAFVYAVLLIATVGDTDHRINAQAWFCWLPAYLVVLAADTPAHGMSLMYYTVADLVRTALSFTATLQSLGFFIWVVVLWAKGDDNDGGTGFSRPAAFFGMLAAALCAQTLVCFALLWLTAYQLSAHYRRSTAPT